MAVEALPAVIAHRVADLCAAYLRPPAGATGYPGPTRMLVFDPALSGVEVTAYDVLVRMARAGTDLTLEEWQAVAPSIGTLRTFRQRTQAEWGAMTAAQRDVTIVAGIDALIDVLRVQLRD